MHHSTLHDDARATRLRIAIGVLDRRIHRAEAHGLDQETTLALQHALDVVLDNMSEPPRTTRAPTCIECGATQDADDGQICARCWANLGVLLGLEPD